MDDVTICNMALGEISARSTIASLTENSKEAKYCNIYYAPARDAVLQAARWNFARKQIALTLYRDATKTPPDSVPPPWLYEYVYPSDCIQGRFVLPLFDALPGSAGAQPSAPVYRGPPVKYVVSNDTDITTGADILVILTNQFQAQFIYTKKTVNPNLFDAQFVDALYVTLAAKLCKPLTGKDPSKYIAQAKALVDAAASSNGNEGLAIQEHTPDWLRARGYLSDYSFPDFFMVDNSPGQMAQVN